MWQVTSNGRAFFGQLSRVSFSGSSSKKRCNSYFKPFQITGFFKSYETMTFVVDQMNGLTGDKTDEYEAKKRAKLYDWLLCFTSASKAVFSSSAKYSGYIKQSLGDLRVGAFFITGQGLSPRGQSPAGTSICSPIARQALS